VPELRQLLTRAALVALGVAAFAAAPASAHVVVQPSEGRPADPQIYRVIVPTESDSPTVDVRLRMPPGIDFALVESPPAGWTGKLVHNGDRIAEIRWTGGKIPPDGFAEFRFLARNPVQTGDIAWPVVQRYANGEVQRWIGPAGSDSPASRTKISESAAPQDVISVNGEKVSAGSATTPPSGDGATAPAAATQGRDTLTLVLAIAGVVLGALALLLALTRRRGVPATAVLLALTIVLLAAPAALAHKGNPNYLSQINSISPPLQGVHVEVVNRDDRLQLTNRSGKDVVVLGYQGEPYARIAGDGSVEVNLNSPAQYLNEERFGGVPIPANASKGAAPSWKKVSGSGRFEWHDHRAHWMGKGKPPMVKDENAKTKIYDWKVTIEEGGRAGAITGTLFWTPLPGGGAPMGAIIAGAAIVIALCLAVVLVRRRRTGEGSTSGEAAEAW
jgi:uncharacterized protein YcnI